VVIAVVLGLRRSVFWSYFGVGGFVAASVCPVGLGWYCFWFGSCSSVLDVYKY
jgi:fumarate reductase subunit D